MSDSNEKGKIFNIQSYSVHDGPGIRTIVFFKGCPLRCKWCSNPESQEGHFEYGWNRALCIGCRECINSCSSLALAMTEHGIVRNHETCSLCGNCAEVCPAGAMLKFGREQTVKEILDDVEKDTSFYSRSGGGLTLSGGEPLFQPKFALAMLREARKRHINTAMESCALCNGDIFLEAAAHLNYLLVDVKCLDSDLHAQNTGMPNEVILENIKKVRSGFPDLFIHIRTPIIPGFNDDEQTVGDIARFAKDVGANAYDILQYHKMGEAKYVNMGRAYPMGDAVLPDEVFKNLKEAAASV